MDLLRGLSTGELLSLGFFLLLPVAGALWRTASLRGDTHGRWRQRVELAEAGLSEKAAKELRSLVRQVSELLGTEADFNPRQVVADPGALVTCATRFKKCIHTRERLQRRFAILLRLGPILFISFLALGIGLTLGFGHLLGLIGGVRVWSAAVATTGASFVAILGEFAFYVFLQHWLSGAEILSVPEDSDD